MKLYDKYPSSEKDKVSRAKKIVAGLSVAAGLVGVAGCGDDKPPYEGTPLPTLDWSNDETEPSQEPSEPNPADIPTDDGEYLDEFIAGEWSIPETEPSIDDLREMATVPGNLSPEDTAIGFIDSLNNWFTAGLSQEGIDDLESNLWNEVLSNDFNANIQELAQKNSEVFADELFSDSRKSNPFTIDFISNMEIFNERSVQATPRTAPPEHYQDPDNKEMYEQSISLIDFTQNSDGTLTLDVVVQDNADQNTAGLPHNPPNRSDRAGLFEHPDLRFSTPNGSGEPDGLLATVTVAYDTDSDRTVFSIVDSTIKATQ